MHGVAWKEEKVHRLGGGGHSWCMQGVRRAGQHMCWGACQDAPAWGPAQAESEVGSRMRVGCPALSPLRGQHEKQ